MHTETFKAEYIYDCDLDVVNIEVVKKYEHGRTIDLTFGIFLDFDKDLLPVNLEIITASKVIGVEKECLIDPDGEVTITINNTMIEAEITFHFEDKNETLQLTVLNDFGFPTSETSFALV